MHNVISSGNSHTLEPGNFLCTSDVHITIPPALQRWGDRSDSILSHSAIT